MTGVTVRIAEGRLAYVGADGRPVYPGQVVVVSKDVAEKLIAAGDAEPVEPQRKRRGGD